MMKVVEERFSVAFAYPVIFCRGLFGEDCGVLDEVLGRDAEAPPAVRWCAAAPLRACPDKSEFF